MAAPLSRCLLVTPISIHEPANGLAHRARFWRDVLAHIGGGDPAVVLVPIHGDGHPGDEVASLPASVDFAGLEHLGRQWAQTRGPFDLVVGFRLAAAPFALGAAAAGAARVVVDFDDDETQLAVDRGATAAATSLDATVRRVAARCDLTTSVAGFGHTHAVPNSVESPSPAPRRAPASPPTVVMVGNFTYPPNAEAGYWFCERVLPLAGVPWEFVAAGRGSEQFGERGRGVVADLGELYTTASVAVVPLLTGSGTRIKAIEAMAYGVPLAGTTVGLEGLGIVNGVHALVADEPVALAAAIDRLVSDPVAASEVARAATALAARFDRRAVIRAAAGLLAAVGHNGLMLLHHADDLHITETDDGLVVLDRATMTAHHLNPTAASVFVLCDGATAEDDIATTLQQVYATGEPPRAAVDEAVRELESAGLLVRRQQA